MLPSRPLHTTRRGQVAVLVAVMLVALLAIVGLAIDGGMEAGNFRQAQNAADAAATAAARWAYQQISTTGVVPTQTQVQTQVDKYLAENKGTPGVAILDYPTRPGRRSGSAEPYTLAAASLPSTTAASATANLVDLSIGPNLGVAASTTAVKVGASQAGVGSDTNGATALAQDEVAQVSNTTTVTVLGVPVTSTTTVDALCVSSTASTTGATPQTSCPGGSGSASYGVLGSQMTTASVNSAGVPGASAQETVVNAATGVQTLPLSVGNLSASATLTANDNRILGGATPSVASAITADNLTVSLPGGITITAPLIMYRVLISGSYNVTSTSTTSGQTTTTTTNASMGLTASETCSNAPTLTVTGPGFTGYLTVSGNCTVSSALPTSVTNLLAAAGITLNVNVLTPANGQCTANATTCSISACFLQASVRVLGGGPQVASLCAVEANASLSVTGGGSTTTTTTGSTSTSSSSTTTSGGSTSTSSSSTSTSGGSTTYVPLLTPWSVTVRCHVPTQTFFLGVLGWHQTNPAAIATAQILNVTDVSQTAFAASPYAIPDTGISQDDGVPRSLLINSGTQSPMGHTFYLFGSSMSTDYPGVVNAPSGWQGQVSTSTAHSIGSQLTPVTGSGSGPAAFVSGGSYYVLPIVSPVSWTVEAYGVFQGVSGSPHVGKLVDSVPAQSGPLPQAVTSSGVPWFNGQPYQAVAIKLSA